MSIGESARAYPSQVHAIIRRHERTSGHDVNHEVDAGRTPGRLSAVAQAPLRWLRAVPVSDPVDRRNAPMLQIILGLLALLPPLLWGYRLLAVAVPMRDQEYVAMASGLALSALAFFAWWLVRRGRFRLAVGIVLSLVALIVLLTNVANGMGSGSHELPLISVWLVMAGLLLGRRALWALYLWLMVAFALGTWTDIRRGDNPFSRGDLMVGWVIQCLLFLFVAVVIDRSVAALRESLRLATERGDALAQSNLQLQGEMQRRESLQTQLVHAQKVDAVGRLAAGLAHDFNHLLGLVLGYARRGRRHSVEAAAVEAFDGIESAARRAQAVSQKLLSFSRLDDAHAEVFDAAQVIEAMRPMLRQLFDPGVALEIATGDAPLPIRFDRSQLELIVLNIAANAGQAMPGGGRFGISVARDDAWAVLVLADTGHGMPAEVRERIFEPFFTTRAAGEGTGLGMSVAHDLIVQAGGDIAVDSMPGQGSTFRLRLPMMKADGLSDA